MTDAAEIARGVVQLRPHLDACPICGSRPRRYRRKKEVGVVCYAGSHRLQSIGDDQMAADQIWNDMAADWAKRNSREGQVNAAFGVIEAIAAIQHIATAVDRNGLDSHSAQLRDAARILRSAFLQGQTSETNDAWMSVSEVEAI